MTDELKPCGHCGTTPLRCISLVHKAICGGCGLCITRATKDELTEAWNRRDHSHIEVTDAMVEAAVAAYHADDPSVLQEEGNHWLVDGMRLALTAALNVKEG